MRCRHCGVQLQHTFLDLGFAPPSNAYLSEDDLSRPEIYYPLKIKVCDRCWLVQTEDYAEATTLFTPDYAYFSSTSNGWLAHAKHYSESMINDLGLDRDSYVIEVACNDGYLLKNFVASGIPCLGIEPTASTADAAEKIGVPVLRKFFSERLGKQLAHEGKRADLIAGNNVYAHVPDINDFTKGLKALLKPEGTITLEFPHLMQLIEHAQFDTVYHEHFSYLSLYTVSRIFSAAGLRVWNIEELSTHGGSLRVYGCHQDDPRETRKTVLELLQLETDRGIQRLDTYYAFQSRAERIKHELLAFLLEQKRHGKTVAAYGAAAKGSTLLNYAGIKPDLLPFVCDAAKAKQSRFMPGSHIPILEPKSLTEAKPDYVLILPWNIASEIKSQNEELEKNGTKFVIAIPRLQIF
jgi:SAM-dependent methyltransferase